LTSNAILLTSLPKFTLQRGLEYGTEQSMAQVHYSMTHLLYFSTITILLNY